MAEGTPYRPREDGKYPVQTIDLGVANSEVVFNLVGATVATVQLVDQQGAVHTGSTVSVRISNDANNPQTFPTGAVTFTTTAGITAKQDVEGFGYLHVGVTTLGSGAGKCDVWVVAKKVG